MKAEIVLMFIAEGWNVMVYKSVGSLTDFAHVEYCTAPEVLGN
jgi:hypothetical protein